MRGHESEAKTVGEDLPKEMARVRELIPLYDEVPAGKWAAQLMRQDLDRAARAMAEGDIVEMLRAYASLKEYNA